MARQGTRAHGSCQVECGFGFEDAVHEDHRAQG
jgi:hypothetical protein